MSEYDYFMIRVRRSAGKAGVSSIAGVIERLGSGEKRDFDNVTQLVRLVECWPDTVEPDVDGNAAARG